MLMGNEVSASYTLLEYRRAVWKYAAAFSAGKTTEAERQELDSIYEGLPSDKKYAAQMFFKSAQENFP